MNQESNFLNQWFHLRYQEDLSEFDDGLSLSNLYALVGAGRLLGSVLLLAAVMLHRHCGVAWLYLLPSLLVGAGMIVLVERLWRVVRKPRLQGEVLLVSDRWIWLFLPVMFAMAFYYDFYLQVSDGHWALCLALLAAGALFHITFLKSMGMFGAVLVIFFVVQHVTTDQLIWTVQSGTIMLAAVFGLFFSHQKMRGTLTALLEVKKNQADVIRAEEARNMIRQLQPHFLYNTLVSIQCLCKSDYRRAQGALDQFCQVLRGNMGSISRRNKIPFEQELEHTKNYVELEQLRFGDRITVQYDIQTGGFLIPALTLQSVVENSIKHGLCNRKYGGIIMINCRPRGKWVEITVVDSGGNELIPNDSWQKRWKDDLNHVGLETVQARLQSVMEGTIVLTYEEGIGGVVMGFDDGKQALEYVSSSEESLPYAFLDIRLRGMLGIELAKEIKEIRSETRIIFCSAYTEYALDAFSVHAVGYLLKPITKAKIQETLDQIDMMLNRDPEPERQKLVVQTFGHFEAFFNDKPLPWERAKAKELLAFLVDQRGASATNAEIALTLWEDDSKVRSVQTIISSLRKTLRRVGMGDVLVRARNRTSINVKKIKCDLYDYLAGDSLAINVYQGEYMSNYSWAEFTNASLYAEIFLKEDL